jgi:hypothetical protein
MLRKLSISAVFAVAAAGMVAAPAQAGESLVTLMPDISELTSRVGEQIAAQLKTQLAQIAVAPRLQRLARNASVVITESNAIVVEATRLPPLDALAEADEANRTARVRF